MIFVGFGFLMVFLKTHCWSSIGFNYLIAAWCLQCGVLFQGFWRKAIEHGFEEKINCDMLALIEAEFCAGAVLITMGALLGKITFPQMLFLATFEAIFFTLNAVILFEVLYVADVGGAMTIHMFGAYFGLAASYFFENKKALAHSEGKDGGSYNSQLIAMIGTVFLWMYWPSFNGILASGMAQQRAIINTVFSISASALVSIYISRVYLGKMDMEVLLNATLAGGVMMGAAADIITSPGCCMIAGALAGAISAFGYLKLNAFLRDKIKLHDTCGVHFLHGIPGTLGAITCVIAVACAEINFENDVQTENLFLGLSVKGRSIQTQALYQLAGIAVTWAISIPSGLLFGFIASRLPMPEKQFDDTVNFVHVEYGDDTAKFNEEEATPAENEEKKVRPIHERAESQTELTPTVSAKKLEVQQ